jgi:hypothetical protein
MPGVGHVSGYGHSHTPDAMVFYLPHLMFFLALGSQF